MAVAGRPANPVGMGWARAAAKQSPRPPQPPRRKEPAWAATQP
jgi:hypothetical protein